MSFSRRTIFNSFIWKFLEKSLSQIVSFGVTIILARILLPSDYGTVALITVFINLSNVVIDGGLNAALIQKKDADDKDFSTILYVSLVIALLLYIVLFILAPTIATFYSQPQLINVVRVFSITLFLSAFNSVQRAYISKHMLFKKLFWVSLLATIGSGIIGIILAELGFGVWALVIHHLSSISIVSIVMWFTVKWRPLLVFSRKSFVGLFNYGWKIFVTNFLTSLFVNVRSLIIGKMYAPSTLAFFDRGKQLPSLVMDNINVSIQTVLFPALSDEQDDRNRVRSMVSRSIKTSSLIIFPLLVGLFVTAKPLVLFLLTDKWLSAVPYVQIFCMAYLLMPMQIANMEAVKSLGYSNITLKLEIIKKILEITILIISIKYGALAIAFGVVIYNFICLFINLYPNIHLLDYGLKQQLSDVIPQLIVSLVMGFCIYWIQFLNLPNILVLIGQVISGVIIYWLICHLLKIESYCYLLEMLKSKKK